MIRIFDYTVDAAESGETIQTFLEKRGYSHPVLVHLKKTTEGIKRNGRWDYLRTTLAAGDALCITLREDSSSDIVPMEFPLSICYEDDDILVVNKPAGMPVHPSRGNETPSLANAVCSYYKALGIPYTFRCVNRLDKDTSGLVILAKHMLSAAILNGAIARRDIRREYLALVYGHPGTSGTIDAPIRRASCDGILREVHPGGQRAVTHYRVLLAAGDYTLISLHLETGRTHQIRVHMTHIGHPLLGDSLYGTSDDTVNRCTQIKRQALHSYRLQFTHPITGESMDFTAPLPVDMAALLPERLDAFL